MCPVAPSSCPVVSLFVWPVQQGGPYFLLFFSFPVLLFTVNLTFLFPSLCFSVSYTLFFFPLACPFLGTEPGFGGPKIVGHAARCCSISSASRHIRQRAPAALVKGVWFSSYVEVSCTEYVRVVWIRQRRGGTGRGSLSYISMQEWALTACWPSP